MIARILCALAGAIAAAAAWIAYRDAAALLLLGDHLLLCG